MNTAYTFIVLLFCWTNAVKSSKIFVKKVNLRNYSYSVFKERRYLHDDNFDAWYYTVYRSGSNKRLCSAFMVAKRNDSTFVRGDYSILKNKIRFNTRYYYKHNQSIDSTSITFSADKQGKLNISQALEYKNGQVISSH